MHSCEKDLLLLLHDTSFVMAAWTVTLIDLTVMVAPILGNEGVPSAEEWCSQSLSAGARIGFDPQLMSEHVYKKYSDAVETSGQVLASVTHNLVDVVWGRERPPRPLNPLLVLGTKYSGER